MLLEKRTTAAVAFFNFFATIHFKFRVKRQQTSEDILKKKIWKTVKVVGKFLPGENEVFGVCAHTPVACPSP